MNIILDQGGVRVRSFEEQMESIRQLAEQMKKYGYSETWLETIKERIEKVFKTDHIIHGYMIYQCKCCGNFYIMNLEKGLEDPTNDAETGNHKPVPFCITCICCGGTCKHIMWNATADTYGKNYRSYQEMVNEPNKIIFRNFFWNDPESDCGVPVVFEPDYIIIVGDKLAAWQQIPSPEELPETSIYDLMPVETLGLDTSRNREQRRHGINGKNGYQRPRKNKKLYEY